VQPGDIIQLVPRAHFRCWVNIVLEASIEIEYDARRATDSPKNPAVVVPNEGRVYQPLSGEGRKIRVLVVKPDDAPGANIEAKFEFVDLAEPGETQPPFQALSYFWGSSSEKIPMIIEGDGMLGTVGISPTLNRAIRRLRCQHVDKPLRIWIDAVCINQEDLQERGHQVAMMGSIYARAEMVHIWLDDHVLALDEALRLIRDIYNCNHRICAGGEHCTCSGTKHSLSAEKLDEITQTKERHSLSFMREVFAHHIKLSTFSSSATEAAGGEEGGNNVHFSYFMQNFFHHPWFQRVWVIQEAALSRSAVVYSPSESIPWHELLAVNDVISSPEYAAESRWYLQTRDAMPAIWNALGRGRRSQPDGGELELEMLPILQVFLKALDLKATDSRDKLFALLAFGRETRIADKIPPLLRPDYKKPLERVMADFTRWWILEYRSLDILSLVHAHPARAWRRTLCDEDSRGDASVEAGTPSWVIGAQGHAQLAQMTLVEQVFGLVHGASPVKSSDGKEEEATSLIRSVSSNPLELVLSGVRIGKISAIGHPPAKLVPLPSSPRQDQTEPNSSKTHTQFNMNMSTSEAYHNMFDPCALSGAWLLQGVNYLEPAPDPASLRGILNDHVNAHYRYAPATYQLTLRPVSRPSTDSTDGGGAGDATTTDTTNGDEKKFESFISRDLPSCIEPCFFFFSPHKADQSKKAHKYRYNYGLCPWTAREGDVLVRLKGGKVPYLLRAVYQGQVMDKRGEDKREKKWQLVGECFVQGLVGAAADLWEGEAGGAEEEEMFILV